MAISRRNFIERSGVLATGLWASNLLPTPLIHRSRQVLAQPTRRKLALLVGLNQYARSAKIPPLKGCVTDVELHRELLIHRFGFNPSDILTLTDDQATRSNIETAFITHLLEQVKGNDVVAFLFSGYGCLAANKTAVESSSPGASLGEQQVLLPSDVWVPSREQETPPLFNGIYEDTLLLLLRSLLSNQIITVLDVGRQPTLPPRGQRIRERALPIQTAKDLTTAELAFQDRLLRQTQLTRDQLQVQRQSNQTPGLVLTATGKTETAVELDLSDYSAGLFSLALTQQLWTATPATTITIQLGRVSNQMAALAGLGLQPSIRGQQSFGTLPWETDARPLVPGIGVITSTDRRGQTAKLWLGGLPAFLLEVYQPTSCLQAIPFQTAASTLVAARLTAEPKRESTAEQPEVAIKPQQSAPSSDLPSPSATGTVPLEAAPQPETAAPTIEPLPAEPGDILSAQRSAPLENRLGDELGLPAMAHPERTLLQLRSYRGWSGMGQHLNGPILQEGLLLQEMVRVLPKQVPLRLALAANLDRVERVDATSLFSLEKESIQLVGSQQPADYLFIKVLDSPNAPSAPATPETLKTAKTTAAKPRYGLAYLNGDLLPATLGDRGEVVKLAIQRLVPMFRTLRAAKLLNLTVNDFSSELQVSATLEQVVGESPVALSRRQTPSTPTPATDEAEAAASISKTDKTGQLLSLSSRTAVQYRITNWNPWPVYILILGLDSDTTFFASYITEANPSSADRKPTLKPYIIQPGSTLLLPSAEAPWSVRAPGGLSRTFVIISPQPLRQTTSALQNRLRSTASSTTGAIAFFSDPLPVIESLMTDLQTNSQPLLPDLERSDAKTWALSTQAWATLPFLYEVS